MKFLRTVLLFIGVLFATPAFAAVGTIYIDTGGCESGSTTKCSGTTDSASASAKGAGSTITCSAVSGPGATPGCIITGTNTAVGQIAGIAVDGSQALYVNCATNVNQKVFWIIAVDDSTGSIGTSTTAPAGVTPTGCTAATSDGGIGGRMIYNSALFPPAVRAGDTVQFNNSPATKAASFLTISNAGDTTTGRVNIIGKAGVARPKLETTNNSGVLLLSTAAQVLVQHLELKTSGNVSVITSPGAGTWINDVLVSGAGTGAHGIAINGNGVIVTNSEITATGGDGINISAGATSFISNNYIHDLTGDCIENANTIPSMYLRNNVLDTCGGRGIFISSGSVANQGHLASIISNTIYGNTLAGLEVTDADTNVEMHCNIFLTTLTTVNTVKWAAGNAQLTGSHIYNVFWNSADSASGVSGLTLNSTEAASDPGFANGPGADFSITSSSPAAGNCYPGTPSGSSSTGYLDGGAIQRQPGTSGGGGGHIIGA